MVCDRVPCAFTVFSYIPRKRRSGIRYAMICR